MFRAAALFPGPSEWRGYVGTGTGSQCGGAAAVPAGCLAIPCRKGLEPKQAPAEPPSLTSRGRDYEPT